MDYQIPHSSIIWYVITRIAELFAAAEAADAWSVRR